MMAANRARFAEIRRAAMDLGVPEERIWYVDRLCAPGEQINRGA